jgi:hypothetical protein
MKPLICLLVVASMGAACAGGNDVYEKAAGAPGDGEVAEEQVRLPAAVPAVPVFAVSRRGHFTSRQVRSLASMRSSAAVAALSVSRQRVVGPKRTLRLRVAAVDPLEFRSVAPPSTRSADFVWMTLMGGDAVVTHEVGKKLGINGSRDIRIARAGRFRVGALADNGTPNHADVLIAAPNKKAWQKTTRVVLGARTGASLNTIERGIETRISGARLTRLIPTSDTTVPQQEMSGGAVQAPSSTLAGLHPTMAAAVQRLLEAAGGRVWLVSGYRDPARQYELWLSALNRYGDPEIADNWVARPGHSMHEHGLAVDLSGDLAYAVRLIEELGLPLWRPMSWEPWHFELSGSRG